jgi:hypothetical protein
MFALLERGVHLRPEVAMVTRGRVVFRFAEPFAPLRVSFVPRSITVEDGDLRKPDLAITGSLPDKVPRGDRAGVLRGAWLGRLGGSAARGGVGRQHPRWD